MNRKNYKGYNEKSTLKMWLGTLLFFLISDGTQAPVQPELRQSKRLRLSLPSRGARITRLFLLPKVRVKWPDSRHQPRFITQQKGDIMVGTHDAYWSSRIIKRWFWWEWSATVYDGDHEIENSGRALTAWKAEAKRKAWLIDQGQTL